MLLCRCGHNLMSRMSPLHAGLITVFLFLLVDVVFTTLPTGDDSEVHTHYLPFRNIFDRNKQVRVSSYEPKVTTINTYTSYQDPLDEARFTVTNSPFLTEHSKSDREDFNQRNTELGKLLHSLQNLKDHSSTNSADISESVKAVTSNNINMGMYNISDYLSIKPVPIKKKEVLFTHEKSIFHQNESFPTESYQMKVGEKFLAENISSPKAGGYQGNKSGLYSDLSTNLSVVKFIPVSEHSWSSDFSKTESELTQVSSSTRKDFSSEQKSERQDIAMSIIPTTDVTEDTTTSEPGTCASCTREPGDNIIENTLNQPANESHSVKVMNETNIPSFNDSGNSSNETLDLTPENGGILDILSSKNSSQDNESSLHPTSEAESRTHFSYDLQPQENEMIKSNFNRERHIPQSHFKNKTHDTIDITSPNLHWVPVDVPIESITRRGKMSDSAISSNQSNKSKKIYSKEHSLDADNVRSPPRHTYQGYSIPEFQPGGIQHYLEPFRRLPVMEENAPQTTFVANDRIPMNIPRRSGFGVRTKQTTTNVPTIASTFFPFRLEDTALQFTKKNLTFASTPETTSRRFDSTNSNDEEGNKDFAEDDEDEYYVDFNESSLTMETLAYFLIGTCCGLSILCLCIVVIALRCRRTLVRRRMKKQFRRKLCYTNNSRNPLSSLWQHQFLSHVGRQQDNKRNNSSFSSSNTCNCRCVTWSLGARNLDTQPICQSRSSVLCGRKRLPFGAASTLQYESMLGRRRQSSPPHRNEPQPKSESSNENDSLDGESGNGPTTSMCQRQCTCIHPPWMLHRTQSSYSACSVDRSPSVKNCMRGTSEVGIELRRFNRNCPPPVSGMNYLDRTDGMVYWSSNDERLI